MSDQGKLFKHQLQAYRQAIDADIAVYVAHVRQTTKDQYGDYAAAVTDAYLDMLERGGKRLRGALVMAGYEMCGGTDQTMIVRAATALEMMHAYILIIDDIQDRSTLRRGKPTVHEMLADYHRKQGFTGDAAHTGVSLALNAALTGAHAAQVLLAGLQVEPQLRLNAIGIVNHTMIVTAHGQTSDIVNELKGEVSDQDVAHTQEWKTAHYTVLNPLCVGMVLAGAGCEDTDAIRDYALHTGMAFQITDDIMGVFGDDEQTGKHTMDDIREGKQTLLTQYALEHASQDEAAFMRLVLGKSDLTVREFEKAQGILRDSGALAHAQQAAKRHINQALAALAAEGHRWQSKRVDFLEALAQAMLGRLS